MAALVPALDALRNLTVDALYASDCFATAERNPLCLTPAMFDLVASVWNPLAPLVGFFLCMAARAARLALLVVAPVVEHAAWQLSLVGWGGLAALACVSYSAMALLLEHDRYRGATEEEWERWLPGLAAAVPLAYLPLVAAATPDGARVFCCAYDAVLASLCIAAWTVVHGWISWAWIAWRAGGMPPQARRRSARVASRSKAE